jgi:uncharacterized Zn-binding protein involved in type VI secretion
MPGAVRIGDINIKGGVATGIGAPTVLINMRPACVVGTKVTPHVPCGAPGGQLHCAAITTIGSPSVLVEYRPINYAGNIDSCGDVRLQSSFDVIVGAV